MFVRIHSSSARDDRTRQSSTRRLKRLATPGRGTSLRERRTKSVPLAKAAQDKAKAGIDQLGARAAGAGQGQQEKDASQKFREEALEQLKEHLPDWLAEIITDVLVAIIFGDFDDDPSLTTTLVQIAIGFIPGVDLAGDVRDMAAAIEALGKAKTDDERNAAILQVAAGVVGFAPFIGNAIGKAIKSTAKGAKKAAAVLEAGLKQGDKGKSARKIAETKTRTEKAKKLVKKADQAMQAAARKGSDKAASAGGAGARVPGDGAGRSPVQPPKHGDPPPREKQPRDPKDGETRAEPVKPPEPPKNPDPPGKSPDAGGGGGRRGGDSGTTRTMRERAASRRSGASDMPGQPRGRASEPPVGGQGVGAKPRSAKKQPDSGKPGSKSGDEQLRTNKELGQKAEDEVAKRLKNGSGDHAVDSMYRQSHVKTPDTVCKIDVLIKTRSGKYIAVEVKHGGATRTAAQKAKDEAIARGAGVSYRGGNVPKELADDPRSVETVIVHVDDITKEAGAVLNVLGGTSGSDEAVETVKSLLGAP